MSNIIGLSGFKGDGKDYVATNVVAKLAIKHSMIPVIIHMADPLKEIALSIGWDGQKDKRGRRLLQLLGTEVCRKCINEFYWLDKMHKFISENSEPHKLIIIPDIRFPNEVRMVQNYVGININVVNPHTSNWSLLARLKRALGLAHASEAGGLAYDKKYLNLPGYGPDEDCVSFIENYIITRSRMCHI